MYVTVHLGVKVNVAELTENVPRLPAKLPGMTSGSSDRQALLSVMVVVADVLMALLANCDPGLRFDPPMVTVHPTPRCDDLLTSSIQPDRVTVSELICSLRRIFRPESNEMAARMPKIRTVISTSGSVIPEVLTSCRVVLEIVMGTMTRQEASV